MPARLMRLGPAVQARAFTLVELLIVIGIIALLIAILLPALAAARAQGNAAICLSNVRQCAAAIQLYAANFNQRTPPNLTIPAPGQYWSDDDRVGRIIGEGSKALVCPSDDSAVRSYAMNLWASSKVASTTSFSTGQLWGLNDPSASKLMLVLEAWSTRAPVAGQWEAAPTIGGPGMTPGQRFGAGTGVGPPVNGGRWGPLSTELPYYRHRLGSSKPLKESFGRVAIAYGDGHAALESHDALANFDRGTSTLEALWSPLDPSINK